MFWLGLAEAVPLFTGGVFAAYADTAEGTAGFAVGAVVVCIIVCWCLRHQIPDTKIELSAPRHLRSEVDGEATREV